MSWPRVLEEALNCFCYYLSLLPTRTMRAGLALLCAQPDHPHGFPEKMMTALEGLGLVYPKAGAWSPTWWGIGVNNWQRQQEAARHLDLCVPVPEPRPGENGHDEGPICGQFRELYFRPGFCWCGRPAGLHPRRGPRVALEFLRWHRLSQKVVGSGSSHSQASPPRLLARLTTVQRAVLQTIWDYPGIQLAGLAGFFAGLVGYGQLKAALQDLVELGLLTAQIPLLTREGRAMVGYLAELDLARALGRAPHTPRPGETGYDRLARPCQDFRGLLARPNTCWCGWPQAKHSSA
ncbi:hypothetical protein JST97_06150 [bacterium]|nr:hypothetical protein [bacterium]